LFYFGLGFLLIPTDSGGTICLLEPPVPTEPRKSPTQYIL